MYCESIFNFKGKVKAGNDILCPKLDVTTCCSKRLYSETKALIFVGICPFIPDNFRSNQSALCVFAVHH